MKLDVKIPLLVIVIMVVISLISTVLLLFHQRQDAMLNFRETAKTMTAMVENSLEIVMLTGDRAHLQDTLEADFETGYIEEVSILSPTGLVTASTKTEKIGQVVPAEEISKLQLNSKSSLQFLTSEQSHIYEAYTAIQNQPKCMNCHDAKQGVLGSIAITLNANQLLSHMKQDQLLIAILAPITFIITGGAIAVMVRGMVLNKLSMLMGTADKISKGNYSVRTGIDGNDEIGTLAKTIDQMATNVEQRTEDLKQKQSQIADLNLNLEQKVQGRTQELVLINRLLSNLNKSLQPATMLADAVADIIPVANADAGIVYVIDRGNLNKVHEVWGNIETKDEVVLQQIDETSRRACLSLKTTEARTESASGKARGVYHIISYPLGTDQAFGVLTLVNIRREGFSDDKIRLISTVCDAISIALENSKFAESLEEANATREKLLEKLISAQEEERRSIARELHDDASQSLAALAFNLEDVANDIPKRYGKQRERLADLKERVITTLSGVRNLSLHIHPSVLDDLGLMAAIEWYAKDLLENRNIEISVRSVGDKMKLPVYTQTTLFRIAQESLSNIVKHAEAKKVLIDLTFSPNNIVLKIVDDGKGFDVESFMSSGAKLQNLGIRGMMERATLVGGKFGVNSRPGIGTTIEVEVPINGK